MYSAGYIDECKQTLCSKGILTHSDVGKENVAIRIPYILWILIDMFVSIVVLPSGVNPHLPLLIKCQNL
jgi:hypothetical protein